MVRPAAATTLASLLGVLACFSAGEGIQRKIRQERRVLQPLKELEARMEANLTHVGLFHALYHGSTGPDPLEFGLPTDPACLRKLAEYERLEAEYVAQRQLPAVQAAESRLKLYPRLYGASAIGALGFTGCALYQARRYLRRRDDEPPKAPDGRMGASQ